MRRLGAILLVMLLAPVARGEPEEDPAPNAVVSAQLDRARALVSWAPGAASADAYVVYGANRGTGVTLLVTVSGDAFHALVPGGYSWYAVAAVSAGGESRRVSSSECVSLDIDKSPPTLSLGSGCMGPSARRVAFRSHVDL